MQRRVIFGKAGGNAGKNSINYKLQLPIEVVRALDITKDDRTVDIEIDKDRVIIKKAPKE